MGLRDRINAAVQAFARPAPSVPGLPGAQIGRALRSSPESRTGKIIRSVGALFGRVSYDAGPQYTRYSGYPATGLTPETIYGALRIADDGYPLRWCELCEQVLERDSHLAGIDYARRVEVSGKPFRIQPRHESDAAQVIANFVRSVVDEIDALEGSLEALLWANGQGWAATEIVWDWRRVRFMGADGNALTVNALAPRSLDFVHSKHFEFDIRTDEPLLVIGADRQPLPDNKFIFHSGTGSGLVERRGFMRQCIWLAAAKSWALRDWLIFQHLYGVPQIEGIYDGDISQQDEHRDLYEAILKNLGQGLAAIHPRDFEVKITNPPPGGTSSGVHASLIGMCNAEMSKRIQGETLTTEMAQTGSYNASETHAEVRHAIVLADARKLARTLRDQLFRPILELNLPTLAAVLGVSPEEIRASVPWILWRIDRETSPRDRADIIAKAINEWGLGIDEDQVRDEFGLNAPPPGKKPLGGKPISVGTGGLAPSLEASEGGVEAPPKDSPKPAPAAPQPTPTTAPEPAGGKD